MNITRNIMAAALMFLVFLMIPGYLNFIGLGSENITPPPSNNENRVGFEEKTTLVDVGVKVFSDNPVSAVEIKNLHIITDLYALTLSNRAGGSLLEYRLIDKEDGVFKYAGSYDLEGVYNKNNPVLLHSDLLNLGCSPCLSVDNRQFLFNHPFQLINSFNRDTVYLSGDNQLVLTYKYESDLGDFVEKNMVLWGNSYNINSSFNFNLSGKNRAVEISWLSGIMPAQSMVADELSYSSAYVALNGDLESITQSSVDGVPFEKYDYTNTDWFAIRNKFFAVSILPDEPADYSLLSSNNVLFGNRETTPVYKASLGYKMTSGSLAFKTYLGPLDTESIAKFDSSLESIMNFGWAIVRPFSKFIVWFLKLMHDSVGINYGIILIFLAFLMRVIMGPLTKKAYESSIKMKTVTPLQKEIQEKYKNDPQKLQKELGKLWKKHGFNPAMSCIAPLLQMPVLMSFFIVFRSTVEFRGQPFVLWITDLSQPDYIFNLPFVVPLYGSSVAILPILMGISMFLTMRVSMQSAEDSQKYVMYFMNGFFILIFNTFPSGLTLYYTIYNFLSYQQQLSIKNNS